MLAILVISMSIAGSQDAFATHTPRYIIHPVLPPVEIEQIMTGGGNDEYKTAPTSSIDWNTRNLLVDNGITVNRVGLDITDPFHTDFNKLHMNTGTLQLFDVKTYAQNGGLMIQEIAFGILEVGDYNSNEALIEVYYNYDKSIKEIVIVQDTQVINESSLAVATSQVLCRADAEAMCYLTQFLLSFNEPLQNDVFAIKAIDMTRRSIMPHFLNDGIILTGDSFNPMLTKQIVSTEKYEGLIPITQNEKYSNLWTAEDDRIFDADNYFSQTNKVIQRGDNDKRGSQIMQWIADGQAYLASQLYFDSSEIQGGSFGQ